MSEYDGLPKAVQREVEELAQFEAQFVGTPEADDQDGPEQPETPAAEQASAEAPDFDEKEQAPQQDAIDWKSRFKVLQGKYDSEVPALAGQLRSLRIQNTELLNEVTALKEAQDQKPEPTPSTQHSYEVNTETLEDYGPEFSQLATQHNKLVERNGQLETELQDIRQRLSGQEQAQVQQQAAQANRLFISKLDELLPEWKAVNEEAAFDDWLLATNRKDSFVRSAEQGDAEYVATIMRMYQDQNNQKTTEDTAKSQQQAQQRIEQQVTPTTSTVPAPTEETPQGRVWRMNEVNSFYDQLARGRFPFNMGDVVVSSYEDATRIDADITRAGAENRIVG